MASVWRTGQPGSGGQAEKNDTKPQGLTAGGAGMRLKSQDGIKPFTRTQLANGKIYGNSFRSLRLSRKLADGGVEMNGVEELGLAVDLPE